MEKDEESHPYSLSPRKYKNSPPSPKKQN